MLVIQELNRRRIRLGKFFFLVYSSPYSIYYCNLQSGNRGCNGVDCYTSTQKSTHIQPISEHLASLLLCSLVSLG